MEVRSIWDVTCPDTYAPSHLALVGVEADSVADVKAEQFSWYGGWQLWQLKLSTTRRQNIKSWTRCTIFASGNQDIRSFWPYNCSLFFSYDVGKWVAAQLKEPRAYFFFASACGYGSSAGNAEATLLGTSSWISCIALYICWSVFVTIYWHCVLLLLLSPAVLLK